MVGGGTRGPTGADGRVTTRATTVVPDVDLDPGPTLLTLRGVLRGPGRVPARSDFYSTP